MANQAQHGVIIENREKMTVSGVLDVDSFDEQTVVLLTEKGKMTVRGDGLKVLGFTVETGDLQLQGNIIALGYSTADRKNGFLGRMLK
ncbi:MAG: sporulation protein YabP [Ruminococcaceae bacterium]|nr:sporulation protein YabP [Oscillospiraceae bacterium]